MDTNAAKRVELQLWSCEVDGADYWVAAENPFRALDLIVEQNDFLPDDIVTLEVTTMEELAAHQLTFLDDGTGDERSLWDEFKRDQSARVIACSEYS